MGGYTLRYRALYQSGQLPLLWDTLHVVMATISPGQNATLPKIEAILSFPLQCCRFDLPLWPHQAGVYSK